MNSDSYTDRLTKCYTGVIHDIMRDDGHKNFTLPPSIRPCKENFLCPFNRKIFITFDEKEIEKKIN